jgi:hypothetical protein
VPLAGDGQALADGGSEAVVSGAADDSFADRDDFGCSGAVAGSACGESTGCGGTLGTAALQAGDSAGWDSQALADALSDTVASGAADDSFADRDDFGCSGAAAGLACCESAGCGAMVAAAWTFAGAPPAGTSGCSPSASRGGVASWILVPVDDCAASGAAAFDGGTPAAGSVAGATNGAAASATAVEKLAVAGLAASPICASGRPYEEAELSQNAGAGSDGGASDGAAEAAGSLGTAGAVSIPSASAASVGSGAAGFEVSQNCASGCPLDGAELSQNNARELSSLSGGVVVWLGGWASG